MGMSRLTSDTHLDELNYKFIKDSEKYIKHRTPDGHQKRCTQNGAMKHVERLRKMVNLAIKEEWLTKDPFVKFKLKFEKKERGFLTQDELQRIEQKELPIARLDRTRDIFLFSCRKVSKPSASAGQWQSVTGLHQSEDERVSKGNCYPL